MPISQLSFDIGSLQAAYHRGVTVRDIIAEAKRRCATDDHNAFIHLLTEQELQPFLERLDGIAPNSLPLYGVPFAIKDNIDLAGIPTTAGCPEFAYTPKDDAFLIRCLIEAGAVPLGKTNLDQFATGLNGTRSPYGACRNAFQPEFISGGSSSGSAVSVSKGWVTFSLGTDTAGSGRVPASFNNLIGLKPTIGLLSATGVVPACRSVDTVSVFALTASDAQAVLAVSAVPDAGDAFSRAPEPFGVDFSQGPFRFGVPRAQDLNFFDNEAAKTIFACSVKRLEDLGGTAVEFDLTPFLEAARLLYEGPWVAERYVAIKDFFDAKPETVFPPVRTIIEGGRHKTAADAFAANYRLKALKQTCDQVWQAIDCMLTPTAGTTYRIAAMVQDPIRLNSNLGYYTNFMNLLDYSAVAVPAGLQASGDAIGLPWGVTLAAPAHRDVVLLRLADRLHRAAGGLLGATKAQLDNTPLIDAPPVASLKSDTIEIAVCGAHMSGLPLNDQLTSRGARLLRTVQSAPEYRFYALSGGSVQRPGMVRVAEGGAAIDMEIWEVPATAFGSFVNGIPAPLGIGKVKLADGLWVSGFVCETVGIQGGTDITELGSWRSWLKQQ
jgi:allophanate hydrolase